MDAHGQSWVGRILKGRYRVDAALRAGGMGAVYRAVDLELGKVPVVVKHPLRPMRGPHSDTQDKELRKRFAAEVSKLIALRDLPGVVRISDQGVEDGTPFYVMDFMAGGSLDDRLRQRRDSPMDVLRWAKEVAATLDEIHARGLVHRDIKPQNLLFQREGGRALIGDFGIVKELAAEWGTTGPANTQIGTPGFMAPEQYAPDTTVDGRCDQFALAATMYVALSGKPLTYETTGGSPARTPGRVGSSRKPLRRVDAPDMAPHVPAGAAEAIARGLAREPDDRFDACGALVEGFEAGLRSAATGTRTRQVTPPPEPVPPRPRSRGLLVLGLLTVVGVGGYIGIKHWRGASQKPPAADAQQSSSTAHVPTTDLAAAQQELAEAGTAHATAKATHDTALATLEAWKPATPEMLAAVQDVRVIDEIAGEATRILSEGGGVTHPNDPSPSEVRAYNAAMQAFVSETPARTAIARRVLATMRLDPATQGEVVDREWMQLNFFGHGFRQALSTLLQAARASSAGLPAELVAAERAAYATLKASEERLTAALARVEAVTGHAAAPPRAAPTSSTPTPTSPTPTSREPVVPEWAKVSPEQLAEAKRLGVDIAFEEPTTGMRFVLIPSGTFLMGSPDDEKDRASGESPQHAVTLPAYYVALTEVTNAQFERFVAATGYQTTAEKEGKGYALNPDKGTWGETTGVSWRAPLFGGKQPTDWTNHPVVLVSWDDAKAYVAWAQATLPSEAQFEYALRGGRESGKYPWGDAETPPARFGNYAGQETKRAFPKWAYSLIEGYDDGLAGTAPVGSFAANTLGLYDISGNAWEWCEDDYHNTYTSAPSDGSAWIESPRAVFRVFRGGRWLENSLEGLRSAKRDRSVPTYCTGGVGFRVARAVTAAPPGPSGATGPPLVGASPHMVVDLAESGVDFGKVKQGITIDREVGFMNAGLGPLSILGVDTDCGCATARLKDPTHTRYEAGEHGVIVLTLNSDGRTGIENRRFWITTNERASPRRTFLWRADISLGVVATSTLVGLGRVPKRAPGVGTVRLQSPTSEPDWTVTGVVEGRVAGHQPSEVGWEVALIEDAQLKILELTLRLPGRDEPGVYETTVIVKTSYPDRPEIPLRVFMQVVDFVYAVPFLANFGQVSAASAGGRVRVRLMPATPGITFQVKGVRVEELPSRPAGPQGLGFTAGTVTEPDSSVWVEIEYDGQTRSAGSLEGTVVVSLDRADEPELRFPVRASVAEAR